MHKNFPRLDKYLPARSKQGLFAFWLAVIDYRKHHKNDSRALGHYVFVNSDRSTEPALDNLRYEFGALEAPGWPPEEMHIGPEEYEDYLWQRLENLIADFSTASY